MGRKTEPFELALGDTRTPVGRTLRQGGKAVDLSGLSVEFRLLDSDGDDVQDWTSTGITTESTFTFTGDGTTDRLTAAEHGLIQGDEIKLTTTGGLPGGLSTGQRYYVRDVLPNSFKLTESPGGAPIDLSSAGTGTHTARPLGRVQYDFAAGNVDAAGTFYGQFRIVESGEYTTFPPSYQDFQILIR